MTPALRRLPDLAVLRFEGPESRAFLNAQLTQDLADQADATARLAGYCSPKGRLLGNGWLVASSSEQFDWIVSADLAASLHKRLSMFILRAKTKASVLADTAVVGAWRAPVPPPTSAGVGATSSERHLAAWEGATGFFLPDASTAAPEQRWLGLAPASGIDAMDAQSHARWLREEVLSAVPRISAAASDLFVPQAINFELVGGVSFSKGCYPGQEVVARSQYLGKMKRRMAIGRCAGPVSAAQDVLALESNAIVGQVVMAQPEGDGWVVSFEVETAALGGTLSVGGQAISVIPLPYTIPVHTPVQRPKL